MKRYTTFYQQTPDGKIFLWCIICGKKEDCELPMIASDFVKNGKRFEKEHKECKPVTK